jgi:myo-inositol-1(or 4)-monophosphatase
MSELSADDALSIGIEAARAAGAVLLERFGGPATGVRSKSSATDLVSEADEGAEHTIVGYLRARRPDDALVAEEGSAAAGRTGVKWFIDPLDGTINYLYGIPHWAVTLCAADERGALAGLVLDPLRDELFIARRGGGASLGEGELHVTERSDLAGALLGTGFAYSAASRRVQGLIVARLLGEVRDIRRAGAASLDLAWVAAGRLDAYFESVDKPWDWMAGALLVREAGGRVTELTPQDPALPRIIASGPSLHEGLTAALADAVQSVQNSID